FYAQKMKLTAKALTMRVSRGLGKSARAVVQERILLEAKRLLTYSQHSIQVIAERTGFEDANYFTRFFKAHIGTTPSEFRRK
ncbi:MAG: AraC family transcriptional regulator, partial [Proteobacteria bacterium]